MMPISRIRVAADASSAWRFVRTTAARAGSAVTAWLEPPADADDRDRAVEQVVSSSLAGRALGGVVSAFERAWPASRLGRGVMRVASANEALNTRQKICLLSMTALVAGATAIALRLLSTRPEPLTWLVPAATIAAAMLALAAAGRTHTVNDDTHS
jgi:hypothetical protein